MKRMNIRKTLNAVALPGATIMASRALAQTQGGSGYGMGSGMMGGYGAGWMEGGYSGIWVPALWPGSSRKTESKGIAALKHAWAHVRH